MSHFPPLLALLSSPLISLSPFAPSAPQDQAKCAVFVFAEVEPLVLGSLALLSQLHCLVPAVKKVQGSCQPLIRQGQSNPDEGREVATWVERSLILLSLILHFYNHTLTVMHSLFLFFYVNFAVIVYICVWTKAPLKRETKKLKQDNEIIRKTITFLAMEGVCPSMKQS